MSGVLALVVLAVVLSALSRRRRRWPGRNVPRIGAVDRLVRSAVRATLATLGAGAVLLLFGQQASAQADEAPEPPPALLPPTENGDIPTEDPQVAPVVGDAPDPGTDPAAPPVEQVADVDPDEPGGVDASDVPAPPDPPVVPAPASDATGPAEPNAPLAPPTPAGAAPPAPVAPPTPPPVPSEPVAVPVATPSAPNVGLWNVALTGRAWVGSNGANIAIRFDGDGPELTRAASDVSGIVITGSDGDDSLEISDDLGVLVRYEGGGGFDALVMPASGGTVHLTGSRAGELFDRFGGLLVSFAGVDDLIGGPGPDTFVATAQSDLRSLDMGPGDRLVVELEPGPDGSATADLLTVDTVELDGTLEVSGAASSGLLDSTPVQFLSFGTAHGDFTSFRGLDLGYGAYVRPTTAAGGYELRAAELPDGIAIHFPSATDADAFFTVLSGKGNAFRSGTPVTIRLPDHEVTGALALSGTPDAAILTLTDARIRFGKAQDAILTLEDDVATLTLTDSKLSGTLDGSLTTTVPDVSFAGTFTVTLDSDGRPIAAVGDDVTVTIAGYTFSGVDVVVTVVGEGADMALRITGPTGAVVVIPSAGPSALHLGALAAALERAFGVSLTPPSMAGVVEATVGSGLDSQDGRHPDRVVAREHRSQRQTAADDRCTAIAHSGRRCGVHVAPHARPAARPRRRWRPAGGGRVDLHGSRRHVAPRTVATGRGSRCGTRARCTEIDRPPARRSVRIGRDHHDRPGTRATRRQWYCHRLRDPRSPHVFPPADPRSPGPLPRDHHQPHVGCVGRVRKGLPGTRTLLSLLVLLHLLWTRGRRSTRPVRPCRRRARGSLLANGDEGGVTGGSWRRRRCGHRRRHAHRGSQRPVRAGRSLRTAQLEGGRRAMSDEWSCTAHRSSRRGWRGRQNTRSAVDWRGAGAAVPGRVDIRTGGGSGAGSRRAQ